MLDVDGSDNVRNSSDDEICDDGNNVNGDGCSTTCRLESCGNGQLDTGEECDLSDPTLCVPGLCRLTLCGDGIIQMPN